MAQGGLYFRIDLTSGRFFPCGDASSPGDGTVCVAGATDANAAAQALNAAASIPAPLAGKWTVNYSTLAAAVQGGTRVTLTPV